MSRLPLRSFRWSSRPWSSRPIVGVLLGLVLIGGAAGSALLGPSAGLAQSVGLSTAELDEMAEAVAETGRYLERNVGAAIDAAIDRANAEGIAVVWLDTEDDASLRMAAGDLVDGFDESGSPLQTAMVLGNDSVWVESNLYDPQPAVDEALDHFRNSQVPAGIDAFTSTLIGRPVGPDSPDPGASGATTTAPADSDSSSGSGILWFLALAALVAAFFGFRSWSGRRKTLRTEAELLEVDRAEIAEQLRDNADRVMNLGDRVIASRDAELIRTYEEATISYQEVSAELEGAATAQEIDRLDDMIDRAQWQFEVIEARLEGRPVPAEPTRDADGVPPTLPPPSGPSGPAPQADSASAGTSDRDRPALGRDESVLGDVGGPRGPSLPSLGRTGGGLGGGGFGGRGFGGRARRRGMGGGLGALLGGILGGMLGGGGPHTTSRRADRRRTRTGSYAGGRVGSSGAVRRPGGSRPSARRSGGGSFGGGRTRRAGGGRRSGGGRF